MTTDTSPDPSPDPSGKFSTTLITYNLQSPHHENTVFDHRSSHSSPFI
jgi:hypothetical protein